MNKFIPSKLIEVFTVPFYVFSILSFYILFQKISNILIFNTENGLINYKLFWLTTSVIIGIIFCLLSIILFTYANFFEKSFPSCITIKSNKPLQGIYKYIRHPSYYVFFFITFGTALCLLSPALFILACINHVCLYIYYMIEENQTRKTNSDYDKYLKISNRFLPNFLKTPSNRG